MFVPLKASFFSTLLHILVYYYKTFAVTWPVIDLFYYRLHTKVEFAWVAHNSYFRRAGSRSDLAGHQSLLKSIWNALHWEWQAYGGSVAHGRSLALMMEKVTFALQALLPQLKVLRKARPVSIRKRPVCFSLLCTSIESFEVLNAWWGNAEMLLQWACDWAFGWQLTMLVQLLKTLLTKQICKERVFVVS